MKPRVILHADFATHLRATLQAIDACEIVFLGNPRWSEFQQIEASQILPCESIVLGASIHTQGAHPLEWPQEWRGRIMIPTGGTGGKVKFIAHTVNTLRTASIALSDALAMRGLSPVLHGVSCTPPWHVSGLMPAIRARATGGNHFLIDGRFREENPLPRIDLPATGTTILSLVPAQLSRILAHPGGESWLRQFAVLLLGGSAVPGSLISEIRQRQLPVFFTYGATETAAACALCPPERIWSGETIRATPLPNVTFTSRDDGILCIATPSLGLAVWPDTPLGNPWTSGDRGDVAPDGSIRITGRADRVIVTGGEKVDPARIEGILHATGLLTDVLVLGLPDPRWGEIVAAIVVAPAEVEGPLRQACQSLEAAARPRRYLFLKAIPTDPSGKPDRSAIAQMLS